MSGKRAGPPAAVFAVTAAVVVAAWASWLAGGHSVAETAESYLLTNSAMAVTFTAVSGTSRVEVQGRAALPTAGGESLAEEDEHEAGTEDEQVDQAVGPDF
jgi:hypothetical protein